MQIRKISLSRASPRQYMYIVHPLLLIKYLHRTFTVIVTTWILYRNLIFTFYKYLGRGPIRIQPPPPHPLSLFFNFSTLNLTFFQISSFFLVSVNIYFYFWTFERTSVTQVYCSYERFVLVKCTVILLLAYYAHSLHIWKEYVNYV